MVRQIEVPYIPNFEMSVEIGTHYLCLSRGSVLVSNLVAVYLISVSLSVCLSLSLVPS